MSRATERKPEAYWARIHKAIAEKWKTPKKALKADAKAVFIGADVSSCTFLHYLEDRYGAPGIAPAVASVKGADGRPYDVVMKRQSPGPREFYAKGEEARVFREAKAAGLKISRAPLGLGTVKVLRLAELFSCRSSS